MYQAVTLDIAVTVTPVYVPEQSEPDANRYLWAYTVDIENRSQRTVQLKHRHWIITNARGEREEVRGPGVVGEQPVLTPGKRFTYTSGCPLTTPSGFMVGSYAMVSTDGESFDVAIPAFSLDLPDRPTRLN